MSIASTVPSKCMHLEHPRFFTDRRSAVSALRKIAGIVRPPSGKKNYIYYVYERKNGSVTVTVVGEDANGRRLRLHAELKRTVIDGELVYEVVYAVVCPDAN